jgi:hypothetical protein
VKPNGSSVSASDLLSLLSLGFARNDGATLGEMTRAATFLSLLSPKMIRVFILCQFIWRPPGP